MTTETGKHKYPTHFRGMEVFVRKDARQQEQDVYYVKVEMPCVKCNSKITGTRTVATDGISQYTIIQGIRPDIKGAAPEAKGSRAWLCADCHPDSKTRSTATPKPSPKEDLPDVTTLCKLVHHRDFYIFRMPPEMPHTEANALNHGALIALKKRDNAGFLDLGYKPLPKQVTLLYTAMANTHSALKDAEFQKQMLPYLEAFADGKIYGAPTQLPTPAETPEATPVEKTLEETAEPAEAASPDDNPHWTPKLGDLLAKPPAPNEALTKAMEARREVLDVSQDTKQDEIPAQGAHVELQGTPPMTMLVFGQPHKRLQAMALNPEISDKFFRGAAYMLLCALNPEE